MNISKNMYSDNSGQIRNKESFTFIINERNEVITDNQATIESSNGVYRLYLDGIVYNNNLDQLIAGFISDGVEYVNKLEGNFLIFLIIGSKFYLITDKLNSRKSFYVQIEDTWFISNNIDHLPKERCSVSIDGLACYIANGAMLDYLTLFENIKCAERSSIYCFDDCKFSVNRYWEIVFDHSSQEQLDEDFYENELEKLLIQGVKRRYAVNARTALSLSAGYDARGILGILHNTIKASNIYCFSYALYDNPAPETDAYLAAQLAARCRYEHEIIKSYKGDLINLLVKNAEEGKCLTNFSDELDAWHYLAVKKNYDDVFAGDMSFGAGENEKTIEDVLTMLHIRSETGLTLLRGFVSKSIYGSIRRSIRKLNSRIIESTERLPHLLDKTDYLYYDQRINHVLLPWRENICGQTGFVHLPFLDGDIVDFILRLPGHLRDNKFLYRMTISKMYPDLFSIPRARVLGYKVNWAKEIAHNKNVLIELILNSDSRLDEYISRDELIRMIQRINPTLCKLRNYFIKSINYIRRRISLLDILLNKIIGPVQRVMTIDVFIIRILLLRIYLSNNDQRNSSTDK
ncbi:MAG: hypothetical protein JW702_03920 [Clostridiales bacterium]|nr:hypothetical protein [Clostridiales bacterium]